MRLNDANLRLGDLTGPRSEDHSGICSEFLLFIVGFFFFFNNELRKGAHLQ